MAHRLIIRDARVVDSGQEIDEVRDVGICDGVFVAPERLTDAEIISLPGKVVAPGFIDMHVHLRDPGFTYKEDIVTATQAAAAGGFTTIVAMPNTNPVVDNAEVLSEILERIRHYACVRVHQCASMSKGRGGTELTDSRLMKETGAVAISDDGSGLQSPLTMWKVIEQARDCGIPVIDHCEDTAISGNGVVNEGAISRQLGVAGISRAAEELMVARNLVIAQNLEWPIHLQHLSSANSVDLLSFARSKNILLSGEVTPHHLCLTEDACLEYGANAKMNPPLREEADRQALIEGLKNGTLEAIATDHAPHSADEKTGAIDEVPFGIIGLETAVPLVLTKLYHENVLSLTDLIAKFTVGPCKILGLPYAGIKEGCPADLTFLDPDEEHRIDVNSFRSKARNSPFGGWPCKGKAIGTMVGGKWVYQDDNSCNFESSITNV